MGLSGGLGYDPEHNKRIEDVYQDISKAVRKGWHETWWGQMAISLISGVAGGLIVHYLGG
jgi:hypothetical protein